MVAVKRVVMPAAQLTLTFQEAHSLADMLSQYANTAATGHFGSGRMVDNDIELATSIRDALRNVADPYVVDQ